MSMRSTREQFQWYARRLQAMGPREILTRSIQALRLELWSRKKTWNAPHPASVLPTEPLVPPASSEGLGESRAAVIAYAERLLEGRFELFGLDVYEPEILWFLDPSTGLQAPSQLFGPRISHRNPEKTGNIKFIWEKSRHQELTRLAAAYFISKDERYAEACAQTLAAWLEQNPFPRGANWMSALEAGLRLLAWVWIELLLRGSPAHDRLFGSTGAAWDSIYWHQRFCEAMRSPRSSANNHLVGEIVGLLAAAVHWPVFPESARWREEASETLTRCLREQFFTDGLHKEQAFEYHLFVLEMLAALDAVLAHHQAQDLPTLASTLQRGILIIEHLTDAGGNTPRYGDEDGALGITFGVPCECRSEVLREYLTASIQASDDPPRPSTLSATVLALAASREPTLTQADTAALNDSGLVLLTSGRNTSDEIFVLADAGPLGYLSLAAHGHADALSFTASFGGSSFLVDPGTFTYSEPQRRAYFRGTSAHNTVEVDGEDQSVSGGPFLWTAHTNARVIARSTADADQHVTMRHDGYRDLFGGPTHERALILSANELLCVDRLHGGSTHRVRSFFHFHPAVEVTLDGDSGTCVAARQGRQLIFTLSPKLAWSLHSGADELGWYSPRFQQLVPTITLCGEMQIQNTTEFQTSIRFESAG